MPKTQTDYTNTIIYKLCCKNPTVTDIYIGHTTNFTQRKNSHKTSCCNENSKNYNQNVYQFIRQNGGWDNWSMVQIELKNCKDKREAELIEHTFIQELKATLNVNNPYGMYKENPQQYKEDWYEENKDEILEKAKEHYEENKEQKLEYQKQYAEEHKEEITEKQKEYREKNKEKLSEQKKEYRETHKEESVKAQKEWREANKEKLKNQKGEIITCECGNQYTFGNKHRHLQSKVHINYQNQLCGIIEHGPEPKMSEEEKKAISIKKQKEYREKNTEKIKEFKKKYNEENKEHIKEQTHSYYEKHKDEIKLKTKKYVEENKDKVKEYKDSWYQKNREKILEKQKQTFVCECGAEVRCSGKAEHLRSTKHKHYVESLQSLNL
jgi:hypothetical protein